MEKLYSQQRSLRMNIFLNKKIPLGWVDHNYVVYNFRRAKYLHNKFSIKIILGWIINGVMKSWKKFLFVYYPINEHNNKL